MMSSVAQPPSSLPFVSPQFFILLLLIFFLEILAIMLFFIYQDEVRRLDGSHCVTSSCYSPWRTMLKCDSVRVRLCFRAVFMSVNDIVCWFSIEHIHWHFFLEHWFSTIYIYFFLLAGIFGFGSRKLKTWSSSCVVETSYWTSILDISISVHIPIE